MLKEQVIFEEEEEFYNRGGGSSGNRNIFSLSDEQRNNINKRLPVGFSLVKTADLPRPTPFTGQISYIGAKREIRVASETLVQQFVIPTQGGVPRREGQRQEKGLRCGQLPQGRSKHGEKIKAIIQRFRKHSKYIPFSQHLNRFGFASSLQEIESQNRKNIHTIESFKDRMLYLFNRVLQVTYESDKREIINEMIDQVQFLVENAQKSQFANSLIAVQKSIDKVTREISEIRETGSYYYKKRKRNQKNYEEKQLLYIAELMHALPKRELVGVLQIVEEKPFNQISLDKIEFDLNTLKNRKIRELEFFVKKKLNNHYRSRERKHLKMRAKRKAEREAAQGEQVQQQQQRKSQREPQPTRIKNEQNVGLNYSGENLYQYKREERNEFLKEEAEIDYIFQYENVEEDIRVQREQSSDMMRSISSKNDSEDEFLPDRDLQQRDDNFFGGSERSNNPSVADQSERLYPHQDNLQFEEHHLMLHHQQQPSEEEGQPYDSSDSSFITDEEDSEF